MAVNYYELLQLQVDASDKEIKEAIINARKAEKIDLSLLKTAHRILLNPDMRKRYDDSLFRYTQTAGQTGTDEPITRRVVYLEDAYVDPEPVEKPYIKHLPMIGVGVGAVLIGLLLGYALGVGSDSAKNAQLRADNELLRVQWKGLNTQVNRLKIENGHLMLTIKNYQTQIDQMVESNKPLPPAILLFNERTKAGLK